MVSTERNHRAREGNSRLPRPYCSKEVVLPRLGLAPCHMFSFPPCWLPEVNLLGKGNVGQLWGHGSLKHQPFMQRLHRHSSVSWESKTTNKPPLSQLLLNHSENSSAKTFQGLPRWGQPPHTVREEWPVTYQTLRAPKPGVLEQRQRNICGNTAGPQNIFCLFTEPDVGQNQMEGKGSLSLLL